MAVVTQAGKTGNTAQEPFTAFKQKLGKQTTFKGFKQHFSAITTINQEKTSTKANKVITNRSGGMVAVAEEDGVEPDEQVDDQRSHVVNSSGGRRCDA